MTTVSLVGVETCDMKPIEQATITMECTQLTSIRHSHHIADALSRNKDQIEIPDHRPTPSPTNPLLYSIQYRRHFPSAKPLAQHTCAHACISPTEHLGCSRARPTDRPETKVQPCNGFSGCACRASASASIHTYVHAFTRNERQHASMKRYGT